MQTHNNEKNVRISSSPTQYCAFVTLRQRDSSVDEKNGELKTTS